MMLAEKKVEKAAKKSKAKPTAKRKKTVRNRKTTIQPFDTETGNCKDYSSLASSLLLSCRC